jgi:hypothetical protein
MSLDGLIATTNLGSAGCRLIMVIRSLIEGEQEAKEATNKEGAG